LIELATEFRVLAKHLERDAGCRQTLNRGARLIDFYDKKIAAHIGLRILASVRTSRPRPRGQLITHKQRKGAYRSKEGIMYHFATTLIAGSIATILVSGIAFVPTPAEAAKMSNAERVALEKATAACKEEAKGMKFKWHWRKRQKYVQNCIIRSASQQGIDIWEVRRTVKGSLPSPDIDDWSFVFSRSRNR
jgi:hypothetical protein